MLFQVTYEAMKHGNNVKFYPKIVNVVADNEKTAVERAKEKLISEGYEVQFVLSIKTLTPA